jgi:hypothetical protein
MTKKRRTSKRRPRRQVRDQIVSEPVVNPVVNIEASASEGSEGAPLTKVDLTFLELSNVEELEAEIDDVHSRHQLRGQEIVEMRKRLERAQHIILNTEQRLNVFKKHVRDMLTDLVK